MSNIDDKFRYELKYVLNNHDFLRLKSFLYKNAAGFKKQYEDRWVNNIYFDNPQLDSAHENLSGISDRVKIRYRWYGQMSDHNSGILELKIRKNKLGTKKYFPLENIESLELLTLKVNEQLSNQNIIPILQNRYLRQYYIDFSKEFRLTIDQQMYYLPIKDEINFNTFGQRKDTRIVVEIKFDRKNHPQLGKISQFFPFKPVKHSKYINGLNAIGKS